MSDCVKLNLSVILYIRKRVMDKVYGNEYVKLKKRNRKASLFISFEKGQIT